MFHKLIDFGSCNLHIILGSLKTGAEKSDWKLKMILKGAFQILHDTPARRGDNVSIIESTKYIHYSSVLHDELCLIYY